VSAEHNDRLKDQGTADLCRRFREETARYRPGEPSDDRCSFEVFRRAIVEGDEHCWHEIVATFDGVVRGWCRRAAGGWASDLDELAALTWEKFWRCYTADKLHAAGTTAQVLSYLKLCVRSVVLDAARQHASVLPLDEATPDGGDGTLSPADLCGDGTAHTALWQLIDEQVHDERERVLLHLRYELGLKSADAQARRPDLFPCVGEVYRVTRNVLDRLRRSPAVHVWWAEQCA
jgi:hypothetical protein